MGMAGVSGERALWLLLSTSGQAKKKGWPRSNALDYGGPGGPGGRVMTLALALGNRNSMA